MMLMLITGVSGPLIDSFFLGGKLDRREIIASKAICQIASHGMKLAYFGGIIDQAASLDPVLAVLAVGAAMLGTTLVQALPSDDDGRAVPHLGDAADHRHRRLLRDPGNLSAG